MATLTGAERDNLPDSAFAYIEPGGSKDSGGRTTPRSLRHFPVHDEAHVRAALSRIGQGAQFSDQARPKVMARARALGIDGHDGDGHDGHDGDGRSWLSASVERRFLGAHTRSSWVIDGYRLETRTAEDGKKHIGGYGVVFNRRSRNLGGFVEQAAPGVCNRNALAGYPGALCRYNHNENLLLGTVQGRTLSLRSDSIGVAYDVDPPQSRGDIIELVERGDVAHSSFAFRCVQDEWGISEENYPLRTLIDVDLVDVAPVVTPAYPDATVGLRSLARKFDASEDEVRSLAEHDELRKFFVRTDNRGPARPKPAMSGAAAIAVLMGKREDPWIDLG